MTFLNVEKYVLVFIILTASVFSFCEEETLPADYFKIVIISPNAGEAYVKGETYIIKWEDNFSTKIRLSIYKSDDYTTTIIDSTDNNGLFEWVVPEVLEAGSDYTIKINSNNDDFLYDISEGNFTIIDKPSEFSELIDSRDGQIYKIVKIGSQWWMTQNFNYKNSTDSYCYENNEDNCEEYGRLYTYDIAYSLAPAGWHLPTDQDWKTLELYLGISLDEIYKTGFRGVTSGLLLLDGGGLKFDAKYAGYYDIRYNSFNNSQNKCLFWSSSSERYNYKWIRELAIDEGGIKRSRLIQWSSALSVRYVKDSEDL